MKHQARVRETSQPSSVRSMNTIGMPTVRQAQALTLDAREGHIMNHVKRIEAWARIEPYAVAELVAVLALMADSNGPVARLIGVHGFTEDVRIAALREAHSAHTRGERTQWAVDGERIYQRDKRRRYAEQGEVA